MVRPDFLEMARAWLVRAQGHSRPESERSLATELESAWELGIANAIEVVAGAPLATPTDDGIEALTAAIRQLTDKPVEPRGN